MKRLSSLFVLFALLAVLVTGCGSSEGTAATVNGTEITEQQLEEELDAIRSNERFIAFLEQPNTAGGAPLRVTGEGDRTIDAGFVAQVLRRQIVFEVLEQELAERDIEISDQVREQARQTAVESVGGQETFEAFSERYQERLVRREAVVAALQQALADRPVDDRAVRQFYEENQERFSQSCARHILFSEIGDDGQVDFDAVEANEDALLREAEQAAQDLAAGGDFAEIARERSDDPGSGAEGGDLQCGPAGRFVPAFEEAMAELEIDQVSAPVRTDFGYHLIQVTERRVQPFEEVQGQIRQQLLQDSQAGFQTAIEEAFSEAEIEVNPRYGRFDAQRLTVVPPDAPATSVPGTRGGEQEPAGSIPLEQQVPAPSGS